MKELIKPFSALSKKSVKEAGGKGASLGEMTKAGIPVPPGFVLLANAFETFLEETDLTVEIETILKTVDHRMVHTIEDASEKISALILNAQISQNFQETILLAFDKLNVPFVAVRSSDF
ncbi:hypothetical protein A2239_01445 [Candidatus Uhrbacteria bacterium RIFOXYA2_FULL_40_9]|nr:MAG: Phosphoenolpyruvate synthase [Candidatus Uhrbacteria bacterium GW2011_GWF2_40_263]OGL94273.1 MAG: hypothetical protein A2239_01445 [Candidatus Uhrbacteria bacterium RIFOXYA2_FULL_40_9]OGL98318.1 MAG: hypothetical protein A2332_03760 [Candidatus Uhrbacteria bacterium RIFOXYB2_FULL_41_18]HBK34992.1 hypothetical protein [Candidatus Uhrbacteria bacterium]HCB56034.1 hypothetical protein [Candidatus Uhrbacteria bacterium]